MILVGCGCDFGFGLCFGFAWIGWAWLGWALFASFPNVGCLTLGCGFEAEDLRLGCRGWGSGLRFGVYGLGLGFEGLGF